MGFVKMHHPDTGGVQDAPEELVDHWAERGWRLGGPDADATPATVVLTRDGDNAVVPVDAADEWRADGWTDTEAQPDPSTLDGDTNSDDAQEGDQ